ncbi:copper resistance protein CopC [Rhodococcus sp. T2V]|uniref:copper resistance CopC family protein n=1 Tax=Rhodococcus sp. T2V TaxID=3034164 RepID=UPI0023E243A9|nr:copper resistance protein CopC [Rhodococcus sp. T2V]MDF3311947.1 copper resistance protein CopC [Rhodococcus sp. T2V]
MSVDLDGLGDAGQYTVAFRVVSDDGHPIEGSYTFQLTQAGPGARDHTRRGRERRNHRNRHGGATGRRGLRRLPRLGADRHRSGGRRQWRGVLPPQGTIRR